MLALILASTLALAPGQNRAITVTGEARISFRPNQVVAVFSVTSSNREAAAARKATEEKFTKLTKACRDVGLEQKSLIVTESAPQPEYRGNEIVGYSFTRSASITFTDMPRLDEALTAISRSGATLVGTVMLQNTEHVAFETKARIAAAAAARERAKGIIEALGAKLGLPISVGDSTPRIESVQGGVLAPGADGTVVTGFANRELSVLSQLTVSFDIEPQP